MKNNEKTNKANKKGFKQNAKKTDNKLIYAGLALVIFITAGIYFKSLQNNFVTYDDNQYIHDNPYIKTLNMESVKVIFSSFHNSNYHPLTTLIYAVLYDKYKLDATPYHITGLFIHLLNILLVYYLSFLIFKKQGLSIFIAFVFGAHPLHVESVAWVSELKDVLYSFFFISALILYVKYIENQRKIIYMIYVFGLFLLSLFSKSAAVIFPVLLIVFDFYYKRKFELKLIAEKIPFFLLSLLFGFLAIKSQSATKAIVDINPLFSYIDRLFLLSYALMFYITKFFIPVNMSALHYYPLERTKFLPPEFYASFIILLVIIFLVFRAGKVKRDIIFGLLFFVVNLLLVLQILPVGQALVAERYTYIPYLGLLFALAGLYIHYQKKINKGIIIFVLALYSVFIIVQCYKRTEVWQNGVTLFSNIIERYPTVFFGYSSRADAKHFYEDYNGAIEDYTIALKMRPNFGEAYFGRGKSNYFAGNIDAAIADYNIAEKYVPDLPDLYSNRGAAYFQKGEFRKTIDDCNKAIKINPNFSEAYTNRGNAKGMLQDYAGSVEDLTMSVKLKPDLIEAYVNRGISYNFLNNKEAACADFHKAFELGDKTVQDLINKHCK